MDAPPEFKFFHYHLQTKFVKVMFSQASVSHSVHMGGGSALRWSASRGGSASGGLPLRGWADPLANYPKILINS